MSICNWSRGGGGSDRFVYLVYLVSSVYSVCFV